MEVESSGIPLWETGFQGGHLEIFVLFYFFFFWQQAMFLGFKIPERAGIMETIGPLGTMSVAKSRTTMREKALLSWSSG